MKIELNLKIKQIVNGTMAHGTTGALIYDDNYRKLSSIEFVSSDLERNNVKESNMALFGNLDPDLFKSVADLTLFLDEEIATIIRAGSKAKVTIEIEE